MNRMIWLSAFAGLLATSCASREREWPFPSLAARDPDESDAILRSRVDAVRSITAVLQVGFDSEERSGSFDLVCVYREPNQLFMSAFKSLLLASRPIFEMAFSGDRYRVALHDDKNESGGGADGESTGSLEDFPEEQADLAALFWLRELMFLPGKSATPWRLAADERSSKSIELTGRSRDDCELRLVADHATLGIRSQLVRPPRGAATYEIEYLDYRRHGEAFIPVRVSARATDGSFALQAVLLELELNEPVDETLFQIP